MEKKKPRIWSAGMRAISRWFVRDAYPSDCFVTNTCPEDLQLFRHLGLLAFRTDAGNVGIVEVEGHRVLIMVNCMPEHCWRFHITGPHFSGDIWTGSGSMVDYWWAVTALVQGKVRITLPGRTYAVAGSLPNEMMQNLRRLLSHGMLVVRPSL